MHKLITTLLLCSLASCGEADLGPPTAPVPAPPDFPGGLETTSSGLSYGYDFYPMQGIDYATNMGTFTCNYGGLVGTVSFQVYGAFELVLVSQPPRPGTVASMRAVFHGVTWAQTGGIGPVTLDGSVGVQESGNHTLVNPYATCESCSQGNSAWPPGGPSVYAGNNAYPNISPQAQLHVPAGQFTVYPSYYSGDRGWVIAQHMTFRLPNAISCSELNTAWQRQQAMPQGMYVGGTCFGGPC